MLPRDLPPSEKKILAQTMARRIDESVAEISRQLGAPHSTVLAWVNEVRPPKVRIPRGLAAGQRKYNEYMREAGIPVADRIKALEEARRAA
ncbi:hypothetical protein [Microvirga mediterraneensis]|uniref:Homeodomain-like domain-containing protein n=1 Tax=Microvirga mediterraneensis TaxID=2754695 RepID=A0A838BW90_9HYPH|nr:hypothetical protein [Microvirga mediterraneensis]MBA1159372.1 hypothetical protein [Microvirga mediterraneensis]